MSNHPSFDAGMGTTVATAAAVRAMEPGRCQSPRGVGVARTTPETVQHRRDGIIAATFPMHLVRTTVPLLVGLEVRYVSHTR
jgi:hypothetical protein